MSEYIRTNKFDTNECLNIFIKETLPEAQRTQGIASKLELSLQLMVAPLALVPNLATRWRHLHELKNWPQDGATCISCKFSHQLESLALPHCVGMPYWHYQLVLSLYLHQLESHQLSLHKWLSELETTRPIDRTRDTWVR